jgi:hypothetical protein
MKRFVNPTTTFFVSEETLQDYRDYLMKLASDLEELPESEREKGIEYVMWHFGFSCTPSVDSVLRLLVMEQLQKHILAHISSAQREYIEIYGKSIMRRRICVLDAHGIFENKRWFFLDGGVRKSVEVFVKNMDGRYSCIVLCVCNPSSSTIVSNRSLLCLPDRHVGIGSQFDPEMLSINGPEMEFHYSLMHPEEGEIDNYVVDWALAKLHRSLLLSDTIV